MQRRKKEINVDGIYLNICKMHNAINLTESAVVTRAALIKVREGEISDSRPINSRGLSDVKR